MINQPISTNHGLDRWCIRMSPGCQFLGIQTQADSGSRIGATCTTKMKHWCITAWYVTIWNVANAKCPWFRDMGFFQSIKVSTDILWSIKPTTYTIMYMGYLAVASTTNVLSYNQFDATNIIYENNCNKSYAYSYSYMNLNREGLWPPIPALHTHTHIYIYMYKKRVRHTTHAFFSWSNPK